MQYEATLRKIIIEPPSRLFELALGREVAIRRSLSTDFVKVDNL